MKCSERISISGVHLSGISCHDGLDDGVRAWNIFNQETLTKFVSAPSYSSIVLIHLSHDNAEDVIFNIDCRSGHFGREDFE